MVLYDSQVHKYEIYNLFTNFQKGVRIIGFRIAVRRHSLKVAFGNSKNASGRSETNYKFLPVSTAYATYRQNRFLR